MGSVHFLTGYTFAGVVRAVNRSGERLELELFLSETEPNYYVVYGGADQGSGVVKYSVCWEVPGSVCGVGYNATVDVENHNGDSLFYLYIFGGPEVQISANASPKPCSLHEGGEPGIAQELVRVEITIYFGLSRWYSAVVMKRSDAETLKSLDRDSLYRVIKEFFCPDDPEYSGASVTVLPLPDNGKRPRYLEFY